MTPPTIDNSLPPAKCIGVTVRTPAGSSSAFAVDQDDSAGQLASRAIDYFEAHGQLERGLFRLGLVRGGSIVDLALDDQLVAKGLVEGDVLHLISSEPQVDGTI